METLIPFYLHMGLHTKLNVSKIHSQYAYKGPQFYTDLGK